MQNVANSSGKVARVAMAALIVAALALLGLPQSEAGAHEGHAEGHVLILESTVTDGMDSLEADSAEALGFGVDLVDDAEWAAMSAADFAAYRAIILGDPTCQVGHDPTTGGVSQLQAAEDNAEVWAEAVTGNVVVVGTDPEYHSSYGPGGAQGGDEVTESGISFATTDADRTGAYVTTSCYYNSVDDTVPVPALDGFGTFTATDVPGCFDDIAIVAEHPDLGGYTEDNLSDWGCSVHNAFVDWPLDFEVLGLALDGDAYTAPDGQVGTPYILARGARVISDIDLTPETATNVVGTDHTVTAEVVVDEEPLASTDVTFSVIDGPHDGTTATATTDGDGAATFSYTGTDPGIDTIEATFVDPEGATQRSNRVTKTWVPGADLVVDKTVADDEIEVGESTTFAVTVANDGPETATATTLVDTLPDGLELDEATASAGTCDADGATVTCELGDLADGDEVTVEVAVTGTAAGEQVNTAEASSQALDPDPDRASAQATLDVVAPLDPPVVDPPAVDPAELVRLGGVDRIATAIEVSQDGFADDSSDAVVLARAGLFPDALAGTPLAVELDAPLLLTSSDELDGRTAAEIGRLLPETGTVVLLGGEEALSADVEDTLADDGYDVERYGGVDRFDTARIIAEEGLGSPDTTFLATGLQPADALTAGAVAGIENGAVVLTADDDVPAATQAYLDANPEATRYAAGGPAADAVPDADDAFVGATRFETAVELAEAFVGEPPVAGLATAFEFPDALTGGAHVSRQGGPMLLSSPDELDGPTEAYLQDQAAHVGTVFLYGGTAALSEDVATAAAAALATP